ncbi:chemotaxis protein CheB [Kistimonas scapharcae]|uniref:protein-glutamate methylesterase n=1 Tax=Kistimonas scapharcae TaxID=1036133 RepID=A0ABP8V6V4_9GAMM
MAERSGVGIIADTSLQRHAIRTLLMEAGYPVIATLATDGCTTRALEDDRVSLWVVDLEDEDNRDFLLESLPDLSLAPVLYGLGKAPARNTPDYSRWQRRLLTKLKVFVPETPKKIADQSKGQGKVLPWPLKPASRQGTCHKPANEVWVLGASLGGPEAVKVFLDSLPEDLPVAFIYAQHIDRAFAQVLAATIARHSPFDVVTADEGQQIHQGEVLLAPVEQAMDIDDNRRVRLLRRGWGGPYSPSIDEVMALTRLAWSVSGAIIFSGMGEDGLVEAGRYRQEGLPVWTQCLDSAVSDVMPGAVQSAGFSDFSGTPEQLAQRLVSRIARQTAVKREECPA